MTAAGAGHEERMLVDGKLVESETGRTFDNVNPATEEVLGQVADGSTADMHRAIDGARRAFDETDWSTNRDLRKRCLTQLQEALEKEREELREELILEVGCPRMTTHANQLDIPLDGALRYPVKLIDEFPWRTDLSEIVDRRGTANTRQIWKEPIGVVGAIVPWNFPLEVTLNKLGQALATGNTVILKPAPDTPWNATRHRPPRRRADRLPERRPQRGHLLRPPRRRGADAVPQGRPDFLHRIDGRRQADHGEGRRHPQAHLPRAGRQVGDHRARRRRLRHVGPVGHRGVLPRRAGLRHSDPHAPPPVALRRGRRDPDGDAVLGGLRGPAAARRPDGTAHLGQAARRACSAT